MGITYGALALSALQAIAMVAVFGRLLSITTQLALTQKYRDELQREVRSLAERERKASARLEERIAEVQSLKKDLGGQKKRAFSMTEELKSLREEVKSAQARAQKLEVSKPAFSEPARMPATPAPTATEAPAADELSPNGLGCVRSRANSRKRSPSFVGASVAWTSIDARILSPEVDPS